MTALKMRIHNCLGACRAAGMAALIGLVLTGCGMLVESQVSVAHLLPAKYGNNSFVIVPADATRTNTPEFEACADRIALRLEEADNRRVPAGTNTSADWVVVTGWSLDGPESITYTPAPVRRKDGTFGGWSYAFDPKPSHVPGKGGMKPPRINRILLVDIFDAKALEQGRWLKIFEGRLISPGRGEHLSETLPTLIDAMFLEFPGKSGTVRNPAMMHWPGN